MRVVPVLLLVALSACAGSVPTAVAPSPSVTASRAVTGTDAFWELVDRSRAQAGHDLDELADLLAEATAEMSVEELLAYQRTAVEQTTRLYTTRVWVAADLVGQAVFGFPLSDDAFTDFRLWLLAQGRETFERVVADPDAMAAIDDIEDAVAVGGEAISYVAAERLDELGIDDFPIHEPFEKPTGQPVSEAEARRLFPRLAARFAGEQGA